MDEDKTVYYKCATCPNEHSKLFPVNGKMVCIECRDKELKIQAYARERQVHEQSLLAKVKAKKNVFKKDKNVDKYGNKIHPSDADLGNIWGDE
jgi:uncharacterized Zn finger protein (UPF0148 family)